MHAYYEVLTESCSRCIPTVAKVTFLANAAEVPDLADKLIAFALHASYHTFDLFTDLTASNTAVTCLRTICAKLSTRWATVSVAFGPSSVI